LFVLPTLGRVTGTRAVVASVCIGVVPFGFADSWRAAREVAEVDTVFWIWAPRAGAFVHLVVTRISLGVLVYVVAHTCRNKVI
jgi:hypothetical protein